MNPPDHGGPRPNSGRKKGPNKVRLQIRVSQDTANRLAAEARRLGTEDIAKGVESAASLLAPTDVPYAPTRGRPPIINL